MMISATRSPVLWIGAAIGLVIAAAEMMGGDSILTAVVSIAIVVGFAALVTLLRGRSDTAASLAGRPVDERWEHIGLEASAYAFAASGLATIGALAVAQATGGDWQPYATVAVIMAIAYLGSLVVVRARH
jgi:hypothetical protein